MGYLENVGKVCGAVFFFWCSHTDKDNLCRAVGRCIVSSKGKPFHVLLHQFFKTRFIDGGDALSHKLHLCLVHINTSYAVSGICQCNSGDKPYITCSSYYNIHVLYLVYLYFNYGLTVKNYNIP